MDILLWATLSCPLNLLCTSLCELTPTPDLQIWPSSKLTPYGSISLEMVLWPTAGHLIKLDQIQTCRSWSLCVTEPLTRNHRNCGCEAKKANPHRARRWKQWWRVRRWEQAISPDLVPGCVSTHGPKRRNTRHCPLDGPVKFKESKKASHKNLLTNKWSFLLLLTWPST